MGKSLLSCFLTPGVETGPAAAWYVHGSTDEFHKKRPSKIWTQVRTKIA